MGPTKKKKEAEAWAWVKFHRKLFRVLGAMRPVGGANASGRLIDS